MTDIDQLAATVREALSKAIEESRRRYGFSDIEERYPAAMLDSFFIRDAVALLTVLDRFVAICKELEEQADGAKFLEDLAGARVTKLEALCERQREALEAIATDGPPMAEGSANSYWRIREIARAALASEGEGK